MEDLHAITARLEALRAEIHMHQYQYYIENRPSISDTDYDALFHDPTNPRSGSP